MRELPVKPPAIVRREERREDEDALAGSINQAHAWAEAGDRKRLLGYFNSGRYLILAKKRYGGHGKWLPWLKAKVHFPERTARRYMTFAKSVFAKSATVADLISDPDGADLSPDDLDRLEELWQRAKHGDKEDDAGADAANGPKVPIPPLDEEERPEPFPAPVGSMDPAEAAEHEERLRAEEAKLAEEQRATKEAAFDLDHEKDRIRASLGSIYVKWPRSRQKRFLPTVHAVVKAMEAEDRERRRSGRPRKTKA
jgi:hypothetical protein